MAGVIDPQTLNWPALKGAVAQLGEVTLDHLARRHFAECAQLAAKVGLRVEVVGVDQVRLTILFHERAARAPPEKRFQPEIFSEPVVVRLQTAEAIYRHAAALAFESAKAVTRESHAVLQEQLAAFQDNTGE